MPESWVCDGANDCTDNTDETDCDLSPLQAPPSPHAGGAPHLDNFTPLGHFPSPGGHFQNFERTEEYNFNEFGEIQPNDNSFVGNDDDSFPTIDVSNGITDESNSREGARKLFPEEEGGGGDDGTVIPAQEALVSIDTENDNQYNTQDKENVNSYSDTENDNEYESQDEEKLNSYTANPEPTQDEGSESDTTHLENFNGYESRLPFDTQLQDLPQNPYHTDTTLHTLPELPSHHEFSHPSFPDTPNHDDYTQHTFPQDTQQPLQTYNDYPQDPSQYDDTLESKQTNTAQDEPQNYDLNSPPYYETFGQITDDSQSPLSQDEPHPLVDDGLKASFREIPSDTDYSHPQLLAPEEDVKNFPGETSHQELQETAHDYSTENEEFVVDDTGSEGTDSFPVQQDHLPHPSSLPQEHYEEESLYSPYQTFAEDFPHPDNTPNAPQGDLTPSSPPQQQETNLENNEGERLSETALSDNLETEVESEEIKSVEESQETLKTIDFEVPIIDYEETPDTPTATTTTTIPSTPSRANRQRGSTRFAYSRRPATRRPLSPTLRTPPPTSIRPGSQPASSFLSRLQKWRDSRNPSYESLRTDTATDRLDTEEEPVVGVQRDRVRVPPRQRVPPFRRVTQAQQSFGPRPTLRTSRVDSIPVNYPQEFLKDVVKPKTKFEAEELVDEGNEGEVEEVGSEQSASAHSQVRIRAPPLRTPQWHAPPRMYRRDFQRDNLELQRTRHHARRTTQIQDDTVSEHDTEETDEYKAETPQFSYASEIPDYRSTDYASDYPMHASNYPS